MRKQAEFEILNQRGRALAYIAQNPTCTIKAMAEELFLTKRSIWGIVGELRRAGLILTEKRGRVNHYTVHGVGLAYHLRQISSDDGRGDA